MKGNLYAMITTRSSRHYTETALSTFFQSTRLTSLDEFVLIDNDGEGDYTGVTTLVNSAPKSFAKNCNDMLEKANGRNFFLLSNDVVFTPNWNEPLKHYSNALLLPSCNQTHCYNFGDLTLEFSMSLEDYNNRYNELSRIAQIHQRSVPARLFERMLMGFYVFMIPNNVYQRVGLFDEQFGVGGGEDVDYRLRTIQAGIPVKYVSQSYLLHFGGKSTWNGPEQIKEIESRNRKYFSAFAAKWGKDLANFCLVGGRPANVVEKYQLQNYIGAQDFTGAIKAVLNMQHRN